MLEDLKRRVDITRGVRIEANKRLKRANNFVNSIIFLHTFIIIVITLSIIDKNDSYSNKFVLIYSIGTTIISLYINSRNYDERALRFEHNYRSLERLSNKISMEVNNTKLKRYIREYESLIDDKENHESIDYYRFYESEKSRIDSSKELNVPKKYVVILHYIAVFLKYFLLILYPFFILIFVGLKWGEIKLNILEIHLGNLAEWLVAIGTISSVILALILAIRKPKAKGELRISKVFRYSQNRDTDEVKIKESKNKNCKGHYVYIDFVNMGEMPIQIDEWKTYFESDDKQLIDGVVWDLDEIENEFSECIVNPSTKHKIKLTDGQINLNNVKQYPFMRMECSDIYGNLYKSKRLDISEILIKFSSDFA